MTIMTIMTRRRLLLVILIASVLPLTAFYLLWHRPGYKIISKEDLSVCPPFQHPDANKYGPGVYVVADNTPSLNTNKVHTPGSWAKEAAKADAPVSTEVPPVVDNFPRALAAQSAADLPPIPSWNKPINRPGPEHTPLFISFTRNWRLLQQCIVSYIAAGWPPSQIYVVENTGTMFSNRNGELSMQNPFFFNHTRLEMLGVNVVIAPTLLNFAQLQNFFLWAALSRNLTNYFWAHMDTVVLSLENDYPGSSPHPTNDEFHSLYDNAIDALMEITLPDPVTGKVKPWGLVFFAYDALTLVNAEAYAAVGGWDTHIPFYTTDCDFHFRLEHSGYPLTTHLAGHILDAGDTLDDLEVLYRQKGSPKASMDNIPDWEPILIAEEQAAQKANNKRSLDEKKSAKNSTSKQIHGGNSSTMHSKHREWVDDEINSPDFTHLHHVVDTIGRLKTPKHTELSRLRWQTAQQGGQGEPFYRDPVGFQKGLDMLIEAGRAIFHEKWGHRGCDLPQVGRHPEEAWQLGHDETWPEDER